MKRTLKWILITFVIIILSAFLFIPMGLQDQVSSSYSVDVNNDPGLVYEELNNMEKVEKWLINKETPGSYTVSFSQETDNTSPSFIRTNSTMIGDVQTVKRTVSKAEEYDKRIMSLNFDILHKNHSYIRRLDFSIAPQGNILSTTGGTVNTTRLYASYQIDFNNADFFEKLFGKWRIILIGQDHTDEDLIKMCNNLKLNIENNIGRMLDDRN